MNRHERKQARVLVIEDDSVQRDELSGALRDEGYAVLSCSSAEDGAACIEKGDLALVLTDLRLPGASGLDVVGQARTCAPNCPVLVGTPCSARRLAKRCTSGSAISGEAALTKLGRRPLRVSAYNVNCETTMASPAAS